MDPQPPEYLFLLEEIARTIVVGAALSLVWLGVGRWAAEAPSDRAAAHVAGFALSAALLAWFALALPLGQAELYAAARNLETPTIQWGILAPIGVGALLLTRSRTVARWLDAVPLSWLIGVQFYRVVGAVFLLLWAQGRMPWEFAAPAGLGDVATGVLAVVLALQAADAQFGRNSQEALRSQEDLLARATAWNWLGAGDLVLAVTMGTLTAPGVLHGLSLDAPNTLISSYPLVMIPTFVVPLSILLHILCVWKIRRLRAAARAPLGAPAPV